VEKNKGGECVVMKREYRKPSVKFIDYAYDEQVVAESATFNGSGDGYQLNYCTWESGLWADPCNNVLSAADQAAGKRCFGYTPWSLRG